VKAIFQKIATKIQQQAGIALLIAAIKRFNSLGHTTDAAALTYTTLFALVPLLTVTYSVLSMIPSLQENRSDIEQLMLGNLVPSSGDALMEYLRQFSQQAQQLTAVGIVLLALTAFMMLRSIENTFNQVWQLKQGRKGLSSFLLYWAILSLGPLMLSAGLAFSSYIASFSLWKEDWVPTYGTLALGLFIPYITSFLAFTLIYWAVPNCNVPLKHAAIGGGVVALFFEIGQEIFAEATTFFPSYQLIYGAFAAVPLFLLWLYISWLVILLGAEIVYLLGAGRLNEEDESSSVDDALGLRLLSLLHVQQGKGEGLSLSDFKQSIMCNKATNIGYGSLRKTLTYLEELKLIIKKEDDQYFLIRDLSQYILYDYLQHIAPKKWFELINADLSLATLDLFELEQVLVRQQGDLQKNTSTALQFYLTPPARNKDTKSTVARRSKND
jgi:membrane protein